MRTATAALAAFAATAPAVERRDDRLILGDRRLALRTYSPKGLGDREGPALVYFHGGGWVSGDLDSHDALCATLAHSGDCRVLAIDYRLAPEARFPAAQEDAFAAVMAIAAQPERWALDRRRLGVGGDSAGGHLAAIAARHAADAGVPLALQLLLCPVMDPLARTPSRRAFASGFLIEEATMERYWDLYCVEGLSPDDPLVAPLRNSTFAGLPPALIHTAEYDSLRDEGAQYAEVLAGAGVAVRHQVHAGMIHHFYGLGGVIPSAQTALLEIGAQLRATFAAVSN